MCPLLRDRKGFQSTTTPTNEITLHAGYVGYVEHAEMQRPTNNHYQNTFKIDISDIAKFV